MDNVIDSKNKFNLARARASEARLLADVRRVNAAAELPSFDPDDVARVNAAAELPSFDPDDVARVNAAAEAKMQARVDSFINVLFAQHNRSQP